MTTALVVWIWLAIVQGVGGISSASSTKEECEGERAAVAAAPDTVAVSAACVSITLSPPVPKTNT
jgi:hypothetical protein